MKLVYNLLIVIFLLTVISCSKQNQALDYCQFVDPMVGTDWHGHTFPGATVPFGMVKLSPDTRTETWDGCSGYHHSDSSIIGFSHTHFSGTGGGGGGDIMFMPTVGAIQLEAGKPEDTKTGYRSSFKHTDELAEPGYYKVKLLDGDIVAELTTTAHCGMHKYTFPKTEKANVILDLFHIIKSKKGTVDSCSLEIINDRTIAGFHHSFGNLSGDHRVYFYAVFSEPFVNYGVSANNAEPQKQKVTTAKNIKALFSFDATDSQAVILKTGISKVAIDGAHKNLDTEISDFDFEKTRKRSHELWNKELSRIEIKTDNLQQKRTFYTALYHSFIHPDIAIDVDGRYISADHKVHKTNKFLNYTTFSLWDTFRALHPLYTIIQRKRTRDIVWSFLDRYDNYVNLPIMEWAGTEGFGMIGYHSLAVIADAYVKGIRDYDITKAFKALKQLADSKLMEGKTDYLQLGYLPYDKYSQSVSRTLEYSYDDWCLTRLAADLSDVDFQLYNQRGQFYRNLYDKQTGFMRPRGSDGQWLDSFDPMMASNHVTEGNAYQYSLFVPQDIDGLIEIMGGDKRFENWLDVCFSTETDTAKMYLADVTGRIGQYAHGNEPSHHMAYLFNYVGKAWKTQEKVRQILEVLYTDKPDGISGNEDAGQMSSWYVLSSMGFYSVTPGMDYYVIGSPLFDEVKINLEKGNQFVIKAENNGKGKAYIQSAKLNGKTYSKSYLKHEDIINGGELVFKMDAEPNRDWASGKGDRPYSDKYKSAPIPRILFNDVSFLKTMEIEIVSNDPNAVIKYTLDGSEPDENSKVYSKSIELTKTVTVKAKAFVKGMFPGYTISREFRKIDLQSAIKVIGLKPGLKYEYKEAYALKFSDTDEYPVLKTGIVPKFTIEKAGDAEVFSYSYEGYLKVPESGVYTIYSESNDGSLLYIDDKLLIDNDMHHKVQERFMKVGLAAGFHKIKLQYFQMGGGKALRVSWKSQNMKKQEIPASKLFH